MMLARPPVAGSELSPQDLRDLAQSLVAITVFGPDFLFWKKSRYVDAKERLNPMLDTWSLAVEEQYWGAITLIALRKGLTTTKVNDLTCQTPQRSVVDVANAAMAALAARHEGIRYLDRLDLFCDTAAHSRAQCDEERRLLFLASHRVAAVGARYFGSQVHEAGRLS